MQPTPDPVVRRRHRVAVHAADPLTSAGLTAMLRIQPQLDVLSGPTRTNPDTGQGIDACVVATDMPAAELVTCLRTIAGPATQHIVLVINDGHTVDLFNAIEHGVAAVLPRSQATAERLTEAVLAAADGGAYLTAELQAQLLNQIRYVQREVLKPNHLNAHGLTTREVEVLRLIADGLPLGAVTAKMYCSERTVKKIIQGAASRLGLRNRIELVAYAARVGAI